MASDARRADDRESVSFAFANLCYNEGVPIDLRGSVMNRRRIPLLALAAALLLSAGLLRPQLALAGLYDSVPPSELDPAPVVEWMQLIYDRMREERIDAANAARLYGYAGVTAYEGMVAGALDNRSLSGQLNGGLDIPFPEEDFTYDWLTVENKALHTVMVGLFLDSGASEDTVTAFTDLFNAQLEARTESVDDEAIIEASLEYGEVVGKEILNWAQDDGYLEVREMNYELNPDEEADWVPTTEGSQPAQPFWGQIRPFALDFTDQCAIPLNVEYSTEPDSAFYMQAMEVHDVGNRLTSAQREIAEWWVDTPGMTGTPSGHWVLLQNQMVDHLDLNLLQAGEMYGMMGMTLADSFIAAWSLKYQLNLLRPVTYIQEHISRRWQPYIETPPFPEYPSGHSVVSGAAADMLTFLFGGVAFTDTTHVVRGLAPRSFTTFEAAAYEAAISRLYGGIHYRTAIENGLRMGECITEQALNRIVMRPFSQGE